MRTRITTTAAAVPPAAPPADDKQLVPQNLSSKNTHLPQ